MNLRRLAPAATAAALALTAGAAAATTATSATAAPAGPTPAAPAQTRTAQSSEPAVAPLSYTCNSTGTPIAAAAVRRTANASYSITLLVDKVIRKNGTLRADSAGWLIVKNGIANNRQQLVSLRVNGGTVVQGYLTPRCAAVNPWGPSYLSSGPRGSSTAYALYKNANGTVTRWNPCDGVIRVRVNPTGGGSGALQDAQQAITALAQASGLKFTYDGTTSFIPRSGNGGSQPAQIVIAWASRTQTDLLSSGAIGQGGWRSSGVSTDGYRWIWKITQGFVVLDPAARVSGGFGRGASRGSLLLHELGHAAGLGHSSESLQVMYPSLSSTSYASWGSGDRAGLTQVGASKGCVPAV